MTEDEHMPGELIHTAVAAYSTSFSLEIFSKVGVSILQGPHQLRGKVESENGKEFDRQAAYVA
jgi:hypothetical protein